MTPDFSTLDTWILAGQSNMQGVGLLSEALPPDDRVWAFTMAGNWEIARDPLHPLWESFTPVHSDINRPRLPEAQRDLSNAELAALPQACGAGLGLAFGKTMAEALGRPVGLIPAAHGGTSLEQWNPALKDQGGHSLYGAMLERIERAGAPIRGILWYQGESDAVGGVGATYGERMAAWIAAARADLGQPDLPVLVVQLGKLVTADPAWKARERDWDLVREALSELPAQVPHTACTAAVDLGLTDSIHINSAGLVRLGQRMARQAMQLTKQPQLPAGPCVEGLELATAGNGLASVRVVCSGVTGSWGASPIFGFSLWSANGHPHPSVQVINARPDPEDPAAIDVRLNVGPNDQAMEGLHLAYGMGLDPCCNAVDEADMPLCSFLPRPVGWKR